RQEAQDRRPQLVADRPHLGWGGELECVEQVVVRDRGIDRHAWIRLVCPIVRYFRFNGEGERPWPSSCCITTFRVSPRGSRPSPTTCATRVTRSTSLTCSMGAPLRRSRKASPTRDRWASTR